MQATFRMPFQEFTELYVRMAECCGLQVLSRDLKEFIVSGARDQVRDFVADLGFGPHAIAATKRQDMMANFPFDEKVAIRVASDQLRKAEQTRVNAAYGGAMTDGGASALRAEAEAFLCGLQRRWPTGWESQAASVAEQMQRESDPEWHEFVRLRAKFE